MYMLLIMTNGLTRVIIERLENSSRVGYLTTLYKTEKYNNLKILPPKISFKLAVSVLELLGIILKK